MFAQSSTYACVYIYIYIYMHTDIRMRLYVDSSSKTTSKVAGVISFAIAACTKTSFAWCLKACLPYGHHRLPQTLRGRLHVVILHHCCDEAGDVDHYYNQIQLVGMV